MNKKILVFFAGLLALIVLTNPVIAGTKIPVTASTRAGGPLSNPLYWNWWVTDGDVLQTRDIGTFGTGDITIGSESYSIVSTQYISHTIDKKSDSGVIHYENVIWTLYDGTVVVGTFEGKINGKVTNQEYMVAPPFLAGFPRAMTADYELHAVLKGTGIFEGKTLQLTGVKEKGDANDFEYNGFLFP